MDWSWSVALPWMVATPLAYAMYYLLYLLFECSDAAFHVIVEGARASVECDLSVP